jgi:8-oxo-dGTP diphosphatase
MEAVMTKTKLSAPIDCVGVICFRGEDVLLIKRGKAPRKGDWSIPGGRIEAGETEREAAIRELFEETGVIAALESKVATIDAQFEGFNYRLHDYAARWISGEPQFCDDAVDARFFAPQELAAFNIWTQTLDVITAARSSLISDL